jgi:CCR4-NOT complex subunit CAF16
MEVAPSPVGSDPAIVIRGLEFTYRGAKRRVLEQVDLVIERGQRVLVIGANGAGKTTLLRVIAGKHLIDRERVRVLGRPAFHDPDLTSRVEILGGRFPFDVDLRVAEILDRQDGLDPARRDHLIEVLGVDREWHMHAVSDGQRRRVQLLLGLVRPREVLLLDEITTDLDLIARQDLLEFLRRESEQRGTTILYATHIFDLLDRWATHVVYLANGRVTLSAPFGEIAELREEQLVRVVERWLRRNQARP